MSIPVRKELPSIATLVIKVGSRILTANGHKQRISRFSEDIATLHASGIRIIIVSSGAIAHGMTALQCTKRPVSIPLQQACASVGQHHLMHWYEYFFSRHRIPIGQVLLTWDDLRSKKRYLNLRNTLFQLLDRHCIPIVNENDSCGVEEIQFGNNDMLGAQVALLAHADLFVNLTDVGGLFSGNPHTDPDAEHIPVVTAMSSAVKNMAEDTRREISVGGMATKLKAMEIVTRAGIFGLIGDGFNRRLGDVLTKSTTATLFLPDAKKMSSRHRWIAFTGKCAGELFIDNGAETALLKQGKSLLPAGVRTVTGTFRHGDTVVIKTLDGATVARGLVNYSSDEMQLIKSCKSTEIRMKLGTKRFDEVVHRDNLVLL